MCSFRYLLTYFIINGSITLIQGQIQSKNNLEVYNTRQTNQTLSVDIATTKEEGVNLVNLPIYWVPCTCALFQCTCCIGIRLRNRTIDKKVCIQAKFIFATVQLNIIIKLESRVLLNITVSVLNPPAICIPTYLPVPLFLCFKIYDIVLPIGSDFEGCFSLLLKLMAKELYELKLGCVRLGPEGPSFFRQSFVEDIVSAEDYRENIVRGNTDGISLETEW